MTIFQNYIYNKIFKLIIFYIYKKPTTSNFYFSNKYLYDDFNNNELISYSLISKNIFIFISSLLLEEVLDFKNYKALKNLIELNSDNNKNKSFKLIPIKGSVITFKSLDEYNNYNLNKSIFKSILITSHDYNESVFILKNIQNYPNNCLFNIRIILKNDEFHNLNISKLNNGNEIKSINKITIYSSSIVIQESKIFKNLLKLNPKRIHYNHGPYGNRHISVSPFFETKSDSLQSFKMSSYDHAEPKDLSLISIENSPSLTALEITISYHDILKYINKISDVNQTRFCEPYYEFFNLNNINDDWAAMVQTLSNNNKIKEILFCSHCVQDDCLNEYEVNSSYVYNGIGEIINSKNSSIETLGLGGHWEIDKCFFTALSINNTIKTLYLSYCDEKIIFKKVLTVNKLIRNVIINSNFDPERALKLILKNSDKIELYSLTFHRCYLDNDFHRIMNILKSNVFNINEINFYGVDFKKYYKYNKRYQYNKTIINIIFNKLQEDESNGDIETNTNGDQTQSMQENEYSEEEYDDADEDFEDYYQSS